MIVVLQIKIKKMREEIYKHQINKKKKKTARERARVSHWSVCLASSIDKLSSSLVFVVVKCVAW